MLRCGISLPALMQRMDHKDIRMTLRYLNVTQLDLPREFYKARQNAVQPYRLPVLSVSAPTADLPGICQALAPHATIWRCTDASSSMTKPAAAYSGSIIGS
jgi:hypothetical protein